MRPKSQDIMERILRMVADNVISWKNMRKWLFMMIADIELNYGLLWKGRTVRVTFQPHEWTQGEEVVKVNVYAGQQFTPTANKPNNTVRIIVTSAWESVIYGLYSAAKWTIQDKAGNVYHGQYRLQKEGSQTQLHIVFPFLPENEELTIHPGFAAVWPQTNKQLERAN